MATRQRSARKALAAAQQRRRISDVAAPDRQAGRALRASAAAGSRPVFAKGTSKAYQRGVMNYVRDQRAGGKRINASEAHRRGVAGHSGAYSGQQGRRATDRQERRSGADRRRG